MYTEYDNNDEDDVYKPSIMFQYKNFINKHN